MKTLTIRLIIAAMFMGIISCVDDASDANPPRPLDGPFFSLTAAGDLLDLGDDGLFLAAGQMVEFSIKVVDCPGGIEEMQVALSNEQAGSIEVDPATFNAVKGKTKGDFKVFFTAAEELSDDLELEISFTLKDGQESIDWFGKTIDNQKAHEEVFVFQLVTCTTSGLAGTYNSMASGTYFYGDIEYYEDLPYVVEITEIRPGLYRLSDMSFGVYREIYNIGTPSGRINLCGDQISDVGDTDQYNDPFTISGQVVETGVIHIEWSNTEGDSGEVVLTRQ
ncbi:MAG: hypothetical protein ACFCUU_11150 [Cyclobacteriaceae bacterium]